MGRPKKTGSRAVGRPRKARPRTILHEVIESSLRLADTTKRTYLRDIDLWVEFAGADPSGWRPERTEEFYHHLRKTAKPNSAKRAMFSLSYASKRMADRLRDPNVHWARFEMPRGVPGKPRRALTEAEAKALLDTARGTSPWDLRDFAIMVVGFQTGMRRMSLAAMDWALKVDSRGVTTAAVPIKGGGEFQVPLSELAVEALTEWQRWLWQHGVSSGAVFRGLVMAPQAYTAQIKPGMTHDAIYKAIRKRGRRAGVRVHPHLFRSTFVTWALAAGMTRIDIAHFTGHKGGREGHSGLNPYIDLSYAAPKFDAPLFHFPWMRR